jgi:hypothetical protein
MEAGPPNDHSKDVRLDENDPVWRLLARVPRPEPDAWFTVRTLARCRHEVMEAGGVSPTRLGRMWRWTLGGGLALSMALAFVATQSYSENDKQKNVQEAFEIMASMNTDSDSSSSSSSWQDSSF